MKRCGDAGSRDGGRIALPGERGTSNFQRRMTNDVDELVEGSPQSLATSPRAATIQEQHLRSNNHVQAIQSPEIHRHVGSGRRAGSGCPCRGTIAGQRDRSGFEIWEDRDPGKSVQKVSNQRYWRDGKPGNEVDGPWQRLFIDCLKENKQPPIDLEESHRATTCCHLANIAYLIGGSYSWNGQTESILDDEPAEALLTRPRRRSYELPVMA